VYVSHLAQLVDAIRVRIINHTEAYAKGPPAQNLHTGEEGLVSNPCVCFRIWKQPMKS